MAAQEKKADKNARPRGMRGGEGGGHGAGRRGCMGGGGALRGIFTAPPCFNLLEGDENIISLPPQLV